jgi:hypothetical protein
VAVAARPYLVHAVREPSCRRQRRRRQLFS